MDALVWAITELSGNANMGLFDYYVEEAKKLQSQQASSAAGKAQPATVRLRVPVGVSHCHLIDGTRLAADDEGIVAVPQEFADGLLQSGFQRVGG